MDAVVFTVFLLSFIWLWCFRCYKNEAIDRAYAWATVTHAELLARNNEAWKATVAQMRGEWEDTHARLRVALSEALSRHDNPTVMRWLDRLKPLVFEVERGQRPYFVMSSPSVMQRFERRMHRLRTFSVSMDVDLSPETRVEFVLAEVSRRLHEAIMTGIAKEWAGQSLVS